MAVTTKFDEWAPMTDSFPVRRPSGCPFDPAHEYAAFRRDDRLSKVSTHAQHARAAPQP